MIKFMFGKYWISYQGFLITSTWKWNPQLNHRFVKYFKYLDDGKIVPTRKLFRIKQIDKLAKVLFVEEVVNGEY